MRPAANAWEKEYVGKLSTIGFERGKYSPVVFYNSVTGVRCVVHGDDFTFMGCDIDLRMWRRKWRVGMRSRYAASSETKTEMIKS